MLSSTFFYIEPLTGEHSRDVDLLAVRATAQQK
jgi:hypothetical protein